MTATPSLSTCEQQAQSCRAERDGSLLRSASYLTVRARQCAWADAAKWNQEAKAWDERAQFAAAILAAEAS